ncbi:hypothetical protein HK101_005391, partial [Irineochytrium annulatum]
MAKRRKKSRTHVKPDDAELAKIPRSFVVKSGIVGRSVQQLIKDIRRIMEPNTATRLQERKTNKLKDFLHVAPLYHITHLLLLSRSKDTDNLNLRVGRLPRGPILSFRVTSYVLTRDIQRLQKSPKSPGAEFKCPPLLVLNNFGGAGSATGGE